MSRFCPNCGKEVNENADICLNCGVMLNRPVQPAPMPAQPAPAAPVTKVKVPGNGLSIAGMVLGIIAAVWAFFQLLSVSSIETSLVELEYSLYTAYDAAVLGFAIGYTLFSIIPALIGLPLSIAGLVKHKSGKNISGLILNTVALLISVIMFVYIMSFA